MQAGCSAANSIATSDMALRLHSPFAEMSTEEKMEKKSHWLQANYHAKRTGDVPRLLPLVYDLPMRMLGANYGAQHGYLKAKGVHNQGRCTLKGWELHESDLAQMREKTTESIILNNYRRDLLS